MQCLSFSHDLLAGFVQQRWHPPLQPYLQPLAERGQEACGMPRHYIIEVRWCRVSWLSRDLNGIGGPGEGGEGRRYVQEGSRLD